MTGNEMILQSLDKRAKEKIRALASKVLDAAGRVPLVREALFDSLPATGQPYQSQRDYLQSEPGKRAYFRQNARLATARPWPEAIPAGDVLQGLIEAYEDAVQRLFRAEIDLGNEMARLGVVCFVLQGNLFDTRGRYGGVSYRPEKPVLCIDDLHIDSDREKAPEGTTA